MNTATSAENNENDGTLGMAVIANRHNCAVAQLQAILHTVGALSQVIRQAPDDGEKWRGTALDGGALAAATASLVGALGRLDVMLADPERWSLSYIVRSEHVTEMLMHANAVGAIEHAKTQAFLRLPHIHLQPTLTKIYGMYVAVLGDIKNEVLGVGATPEQALDAFNAVVFGKSTAAEQFAKFPNYAKIKPVDTRRSRAAKNAPRSRRVGKTNRRNPKTNNKGGGGQAS